MGKSIKVLVADEDTEAAPKKGREKGQKEEQERSEEGARGEASPRPSVSFVSSAGTHVGRRRSSNEDRYIEDKNNRVFILSDGMGGHAHGEVCAEYCVDLAHEDFQLAEMTDDSSPTQTALLLTHLIKGVNQEIKGSYKEEPRLARSGATLVIGCLCRDHFVWGNVGDSRAYLIHPHEDPDQRMIRQVTADHGYGHVLTMCMNLTHDEMFRPDSGMERLKSGDVVLLCSDGLSDMVMDHYPTNIPKRKPPSSAPQLPTIVDVVSEHIGEGVGAVKDALIEAALQQGGRDNITVIVIQIE